MEKRKGRENLNGIDLRRRTGIEKNRGCTFSLRCEGWESARVSE